MKRTDALLIALLFPTLTCLGEEIYSGYDWQEVAGDIYLHTRTDPLAGHVSGNSVVITSDEDVFVVDS